MNSEPVKLSIGTANYKTEINTKYHSFLADEPETLGGSNAGPDPFSLLLSGIGSCAAITAKMYAERKQWKLDRIDIQLQLQKDENSEKPSILKEITFWGDLTIEEENRLKEISDKCPVQKLLSHSFNFISSVVKENEEKKA